MNREDFHPNLYILINLVHFAIIIAKYIVFADESGYTIHNRR